MCVSVRESGRGGIGINEPAYTDQEIRSGNPLALLQLTGLANRRSLFQQVKCQIKVFAL